MDAIRLVEAGQLKKDREGFGPGDTVRVQVKVVEGEKERIQAFEGVVIRRRGEGGRASFTVRRISYGVGVERTLPAALAAHRARAGRAPRRGAPLEALLPARPRRQGGAPQGEARGRGAVVRARRHRAQSAPAS